MTTPATPQPASPTGPRRDDTGRRRRRVIGAAVVAVLVVLGLLIAALLGAFDSTTPAATSPADTDRRDPAATARAFVAAYAVHDPAACDLLQPSLGQQFRSEGRCTGPKQGETPRIDVLATQPCGTRFAFYAEVTPSGQVGKKYVTVGLQQTGTDWSVSLVQPLDDRNVIKPGQCAPASTRYGG